MRSFFIFCLKCKQKTPTNQLGLTTIPRADDIKIIWRNVEYNHDRSFIDFLFSNDKIYGNEYLAVFVFVKHVLCLSF